LKFSNCFCFQRFALKKWLSNNIFSNNIWDYLKVDFKLFESEFQIIFKMFENYLKIIYLKLFWNQISKFFAPAAGQNVLISLYTRRNIPKFSRLRRAKMYQFPLHTGWNIPIFFAPAAGWIPLKCIDFPSIRGEIHTKFRTCGAASTKYFQFDFQIEIWKCSIFSIWFSNCNLKMFNIFNSIFK